MYAISFYDEMMRVDSTVTGKRKVVAVSYLTPSELAKRWNYSITTGTLANWRCQKKGPPFTRFGSHILYPLEKLIEWEALRVTEYQNELGANDNEKR